MSWREPGVNAPGEVRAVRRERVIMLLFVGTIVAFVVQTAFVRRYGEPYPALALPAFAGTATDESGQVAFRSHTVRVLFSDGKAEDVSAIHEVFRDLPGLQIMRLAFQPRPPTATRDARSSLRRFTNRWLPGYAHTVERREQWRGVDERSRDWLRRRLMTLFPHRRPVLATIVSYRDVYSFPGEGVRRQRTETSRLDIEL